MFRFFPSIHILESTFLSFLFYINELGSLLEDLDVMLMPKEQPLQCSDVKLSMIQSNGGAGPELDMHNLLMRFRSAIN